jgi:hypothetical protein
VKYDRAASTSRHGSTGIATRITIPSPYYAENSWGLQPTVMVTVTGSALLDAAPEQPALRLDGSLPPPQ